MVTLQRFNELDKIYMSMTYDIIFRHFLLFSSPILRKF